MVIEGITLCCRLCSTAMPTCSLFWKLPSHWMIQILALHTDTLIRSLTFVFAFLEVYIQVLDPMIVKERSRKHQQRKVQIKQSTFWFHLTKCAVPIDVPNGFRSYQFAVFSTFLAGNSGDSAIHFVSSRSCYFDAAWSLVPFVQKLTGFHVLFESYLCLVGLRFFHLKQQNQFSDNP